MHAVFLIPLFPLAGFAVLLVAGRRLGDPAAGALGTGAIMASFVAAIVTWIGLLGQSGAARSYTQTWFTWIPVGGLQVNAGVLLDPLSITMALFVTGVASLIHLYSIGYMRGDAQYSKFFVYLNLFVFSMLILVLANNLLLTFVGWEGVGCCSYWLVSFWFARPSAASAGKKAFIYNRIGDFGFLIAMFVLFEKTGSLDYTKIFAAQSSGALSSTAVTGAVLLLFLGAAGKSAQVPLFPWLLDAMEGPTPVSALIHAATMVTAGVYLMCRVAPLVNASPAAQATIAIVGAVTAFVAAAAAVAQSDIKKVLAYSTVSQLGYMFLAVGCRAYVAAMFLMVAHAFYKALLFLGAGSVIHGMHEEQDLKRMGGLRRFLPVTGATFIIGWLAIGGVPPLAGFWAKGDVLTNAWAYSPLLWVVGAATAVLTAYYIGRETILAFYGPERWRDLAPPPHHDSGPGDSHGGGTGPPHESPPVMLIPLVVLSAFAIIGGLLNLPFSSLKVLEHFLSPVFPGLRASLGGGTQASLEVVDAVLALLGVWAAVTIWSRAWNRPSLEPRFLQIGWGVDLFNDQVVARPSSAVAEIGAEYVDPLVIDGTVVGLARVVGSGGAVLRKLQSGYVRNYALGVAFGALALLGWALSRAGL